MKICSLLPSGTEILFALGLGDRISGVTDLCDYPPEAAAKRVVCRSKIDPSVMSSQEVEQAMHRILESGESPYELDLEWLYQESPDVVLTQDLCYFCEVDAATVDRAVQGIALQPEVLVLNPKTLDEIFHSFVQVGDACDAAEAAERLVEEMRRRVAAVDDRVAQTAHRPRVYSLEGINPLVIGGHWIPELLLRAGGRQELYQPGCPASRPEWQEILDYAPEKLFIDLCSSDLDRHLREISWLAGQPGWTTLPAVQSGEVYIIDHVFFSRPGPRVVQGLEILAQLTHPELFSGLIPPGAAAKLDSARLKDTAPANIAQCFYPFPGTTAKPLDPFVPGLG